MMHRLAIILFASASLTACHSAGVSNPALDGQDDSDFVAAGPSLPPPPTIEKWVIDQFGTEMEGNLSLFETDFDGDGRTDWLVHLTHYRETCGMGGCTLLAVRSSDDGWEQIGRLPVANEPLGVLDTVTNGHRDLFVKVRGGGGPSGLRRVQFVDGGYGDSLWGDQTSWIEIHAPATGSVKAPGP